MIKAGEVVFVKISGEPVFTKRTGLTSPNIPAKDFGHLGNLVEVSRALAGRDGIEYTTDSFFESELESLDDQQARFMSERQKVIDKFGPKAEQSPSQDAGFPIN